MDRPIMEFTVYLEKGILKFMRVRGNPSEDIEALDPKRCCAARISRTHSKALFYSYTRRHSMVIHASQLLARRAIIDYLKEQETYYPS